MRQNGSARIALIFSVAVCALSVAMLLSSSALGDTRVGAGSRADTCLPTSLPGGLPSCLPGGSSSASASKTPSATTSTTGSTTPPAGGSSFKSHISIGFAKGSFKGRVKSASNKCVGGRNVVLFQVHKKKGTPVGHDTTNGTGQWKVSNLSKVHGKFYASVKQSKVKAGTCKSAKSKTVSR